jgi:hypothetical protein
MKLYFVLERERERERESGSEQHRTIRPQPVEYVLRTSEDEKTDNPDLARSEAAEAEEEVARRSQPNRRLPASCPNKEATRSKIFRL